MEHPLLDSILEPVEPHVHGFGSFLFDGVVEDSISAFIVGLNWSCDFARDQGNGVFRGLGKYL